MKWFLALASFVLVTVHTAPALAGAAKPPKSLCLDYDFEAVVHVLGIKSSSSVTTAGGKVTFYSINGWANGTSHPVGGSGYMTGTKLRATYSGATPNVNTNQFFALVFDTATNTGSITYRFDANDGTSVTQNTTAVTGIDCATVTIPGAP